jgi:hemolysin III
MDRPRSGFAAPARGGAAGGPAQPDPRRPLDGRALPERPQTLGEEIANSISHGLGFLLAVASMPILVWQANRLGGAVDIVAAAVFSATMMLLYGVSTLYHALPGSMGRAKGWLQRLDHAAIYLFIAGSYTPFTLGVLAGSWGWALFFAAWGAAAFGVTVKLLNRLQHPWLSTGLYVAMGWMALLAAPVLIHRLPAAGLAWIVAGGVSYTLGALVFLLDNKVRYAHFVWHLFVLGGTVCHFFAALGYAHAA